MTMIKIAPDGKLEDAQKASTSKKPKSSKRQESYIPLFPIIFIIGVFSAWSLALLLNHFEVFGTKTEFSSYSVRGIKDYPTDQGDWYPRDITEDNGHIIAIEFGETYSRVGRSVDGAMEVFLVDGQQKTPNCVAYTDEGVLVGNEARDLPASMRGQTVCDIRQIIGRHFSPNPSLFRDVQTLPYEVVNRKEMPFIKIDINGKEELLSPQQVQAELFKKLKTAAVSYFGEDVVSVVMTVPSHFTDDQRWAVKESALLAGLSVVRLINEPTAAALSHDGTYPIDTSRYDYGDEVNILVFHIEDDHLVATISSNEEGVFEILATARDVVEFNALEYAASDHEQEKEVDNPSFVTEKKHHNELLADRCITAINRALTKTKLQKSDIETLILTGDPEKVSQIQPFLETFFDSRKFLDNGVPSDLAVLRGALYQASILAGFGDGDWVGAFDITALSMGFEVADGLFHPVQCANK